MAMMRAIQVSEYGEPGVLKLVNNAKIPQPSNTQARIRVRASGVNPIDTYARAGQKLPINTDLPFVSGIECAGTIESVGESVTKFKVGERVYSVMTASGTYSEYALAEEHMIGKLDEKVSFEQGAAVGCGYYTAYRALFTYGKARAGQSVLIHGASGGVGIPACQVAHAYGMKVLGTAGTAEGLKVVLANGAEAVFNHTEPGYMDKILEYTGGQGPDIIIEMCANVNLGKDLDIIKKSGTIVVIGGHEPVEVNARNCMIKECVVTGVFIANANKDEWNEMHAAAEAGMRAGWLKPKIGQMFPLADAYRAHEEIEKGGKQGKIVLKI